MDVGKPQRIYRIEPLKAPVPPKREPAPKPPEREKVPAR